MGPQPTDEGELENLASRGFKTVVNLTKKGELEQTFRPEEEGELVESYGMDYLHIPCSLSSLKDKDIEEFCERLSDAQTPAYVHCRIGQRSGLLSLIYHALRKKMSTEQILDKAQRLGFRWQAPMITDAISRYLHKQSAAAS